MMRHYTAYDVEASMSNDAFGRIEERRSSNLLTLYAYDKLGRLSELTHKRNNEIIHSEILSYDAEDNVLSDGKNHFRYDELGRLTKTTEKDGSIREYSYDAYGNRASMTENGDIVTYLYDEANQLLSASNGLSFKYDRRGNVIERSQNGEILNTYIYGANNRLERASNSKGDTATYKYNGLGRRISRKTASNEIDYILDQTKMYNNLLEADGDSFVWDENNLLFRNHETEIRNRLGSPIGMDESGAMTDAGSLGFTGYMYDDISGTYFAQAREYVPEIGRFAGRDIVKGTIIKPLTLNNYHYCYSNPLKYVDLDGRTSKDAILLAYEMTGGDFTEMARIAAFYGYVKISGDTSCTYASTTTASIGTVVGAGGAYGYAIDGKGNIALMYSYEFTTSPIPSAFYGRSLSFSNSESLDKWFENKSYGIDVGGGEIASVSGGFRRGFDKESEEWTYKEFDVSAGVGISPTFFSMQGAWTSADSIPGQQFNLFNIWNEDKSNTGTCLE